MPRVTITVPEKKPQPYRFHLDRQTVRLGRGSENDIVIDCTSVSIRHAEMERIPGGYRLRDLGSTNGIKLDGTLKDLIELKNGLAVKIGDVAFDFQLTEEEIEALTAEAPATPSPIIREEGSDESASDDVSPKAKTEASEDTEDGPRKSRPARRSKRSVVLSTDQPSATFSFFTTLLLCGLAIVAFVAGLAMRHGKETGRNFFGELFSRKPAVEAPQTPAAPENPAPAGHE